MFKQARCCPGGIQKGQDAAGSRVKERGGEMTEVK